MGGYNAINLPTVKFKFLVPWKNYMYFVVLKAIILTLFYEKSNLEYNSRVLI